MSPDHILATAHGTWILAISRIPIARTGASAGCGVGVPARTPTVPSLANTMSILLLIGCAGVIGSSTSPETIVSTMTVMLGGSVGLTILMTTFPMHKRNYSAMTRALPKTCRRIGLLRKVRTVYSYDRPPPSQPRVAEQPRLSGSPSTPQRVHRES